MPIKSVKEDTKSSIEERGRPKRQIQIQLQGLLISSPAGLVAGLEQRYLEESVEDMLDCQGREEVGEILEQVILEDCRL